MKKRVLIIISSAVLLILLLSTTVFLTRYLVLNNKMSTSVKTIENNDLKFEINKFDLNYIDKSLNGYKIEEYDGSGVIVTKGKENVINKNYIVILKVKRIKGGLETDTMTETNRFVLVFNGSGNFDTKDEAFGKDKKFSKPEYKFEIVGYIPIKE